MGDSMERMGGLESLLDGAPDLSRFPDMEDVREMSPEQRDEAVVNFFKNMSPEEFAKAGEFYARFAYNMVNSPMVQHFLNDDGAIEELRKSLLDNPAFEDLIHADMQVPMKVSRNNRA